MNWLYFLALVLLPLAHAAADDKIDALVARLSRSTKSIEPWVVGNYPANEVPRKATPAEVTAMCVQAHLFEVGFRKRLENIKQYDIRAVEQVSIPTFPGTRLPPTKYTAVRVCSNLGPKIFLMRYVAGSWWTHAFDVR